MKDDFGKKRLIDATRLIDSLKHKDYLIYNDFGSESRGMTTEDLIELINNEPECNSLGISFEDFEKSFHVICCIRSIAELATNVPTLISTTEIRIVPPIKNGALRFVGARSSRVIR